MRIKNFGERIMVTRKPEKGKFHEKPLYGDPERVEHIYGLSKGRLYPLLHDGRVRSVSIVEPGCKRGKRLVDLVSLENFLASLDSAIATSEPVA